MHIITLFDEPGSVTGVSDIDDICDLAPDRIPVNGCGDSCKCILSAGSLIINSFKFDIFNWFN